MGQKKNLIYTAVLVTIMLGWMLFMRLVDKAHPEYAKMLEQQQEKKADSTTPAVAPIIPGPTPATNPTTQGASQTVAQIPTATTNPTSRNSTVATATAPVVAPAGPVGWNVTGAGDNSITNIGSTVFKDPTYKMGVELDPHGAGIEKLTLNEYFETAEKKNLYVCQKPASNLESQTRPLATRSVTIDGKSIDLSWVSWTRTKQDASSAEYQAILTEDGKPTLQITKTFRVARGSDPSKGYELLVNHSFQNLSGGIVRNVVVSMNGPVLPPRENDRTEDRYYIAGYDKGYGDVDTARVGAGELSKDKPAKDLVQLGDKRPVLWMGTISSYFDALVQPDYAGKTVPTLHIEAAPAVGLSSADDTNEAVTGMQITTTSFSLAPGAVAPLNFLVFFGPKQRQLLKDVPYYADTPRHYDTTLVYTGGFCGFLTFSWLINILYGILWLFHTVLRDWGLAIIGLVCLVRTLLHPITKKAQINMMQMSKMGPEIERIKKKYGDNKDELNKAMMQVYKEQGLAPVLGCLPQLLQTPIWIALWNALQSTFELRQSPFLQFGRVHLTWIADLSRPDNLVRFNQMIHPLAFLGFTSLGITGINVLPLILAIVFFINQQLQPMPATMTPEQEQQRKMMKWMVLIFPVMLYSGPSGLTLYIMTSTTIGIIESKIIRDHIKQRDAAEAAGRIIIDAPATRASKRLKDEAGSKKANEKPGLLSGLVANLKDGLEKAKQEAERRSKDRA